MGEENRASDLQPKLGQVWAQEHTRLPSFRQTPVDQTIHLSFFTHLGFFSTHICWGGWAKNLSVGTFRWINFHTGCPKKNYHFTFCLVILEPKNRITNRFYLLKIEINAQILNTEPFLCDLRGLRYQQNKIGF